MGLRILVISDIHGNAVALKSVLDHVEKWDYLWVLGDLVDYGPEPHVVVDLVRDLKPDIVVRGNHDHAVAFNTDCLCAKELHDLSVYTRNNISFKLLSREQIEWLKTLPLKVTVKLEDKRFYIVHGSPRNPLYGYLKPSLSFNEILFHLTPSPLYIKPRIVKADYVIVGHTHIQWSTNINSLRILNPGSVGQPRDSDPRASYAIIDLDKNSIELHRVKYDVEVVLRKYKSLGIEDRYYGLLEYILRNARIP